MDSSTGPRLGCRRGPSRGRRAGDCAWSQGPVCSLAPGTLGGQTSSIGLGAPRPYGRVPIGAQLSPGHILSGAKRLAAGSWQLYGWCPPFLGGGLQEHVIRRSFPAQHHGGGPAPPSPEEELHQHQSRPATPAPQGFLPCPQGAAGEEPPVPAPWGLQTVPRQEPAPSPRCAPEPGLDSSAKPPAAPSPALCEVAGRQILPRCPGWTSPEHPVDRCHRPTPSTREDPEPKPDFSLRNPPDAVSLKKTTQH